jgi:hypothetical protein
MDTGGGPEHHSLWTPSQGVRAGIPLAQPYGRTTVPSIPGIGTLAQYEPLAIVAGSTISLSNRDTRTPMGRAVRM